MSLWRLFLQNVAQVIKEYQTRDRLTAELLLDHFPVLRERLARGEK